MNITKQDLERYYKKARAYQEEKFDGIGDAIRFVDGTTAPIVALDFEPRIRALKKLVGGEWTGSCCFGDNIPNGCGEIHGLLHLDYKLVNCVTARMKDPDEAIGRGCLCEDNFSYLRPACDGLHGLLNLDYRLVDCGFPCSIQWGWDLAN